MDRNPPRPNRTPTVRCQDPKCNHPIDEHVHGKCDICAGTCQRSANTIAVAAIHQVLFGDLTQTEPGLTSVSRQPDGSWA